MRKNSVVDKPVQHTIDNTSSSPVQVKQLSPDSLSQCSIHSCGSAGSSRSLPVTIPYTDQLTGFPFSRQTSDPGIGSYSTPPEELSPTQVQCIYMA